MNRVRPSAAAECGGHAGAIDIDPVDDLERVGSNATPTRPPEQGLRVC